MTSDPMIVLRRLEMLIMVSLPTDLLPIMSRVAWIFLSDLLSSALVASSRSNVWGFLTNTLAMATWCFWPPENCEPDDPT
mmetsp:Transcript_28580/g.49897  ORF Transcript_28580/g.49897 Transcript_28580/m.49897 type:complete len:80 (+) Transcript_28580:2244-2483(+)